MEVKKEGVVVRYTFFACFGGSWDKMVIKKLLIYQAGMERNYQPMEKVFATVIRKTLRDREQK
jgi:hypothetical protein